jgi:signal peptidase I
MVQKEHWMPVYNHDYQPLDADSEHYNAHAWVNPFTHHTTAWQVKDKDPTRFHLDTSTDQEAMLKYGAPSANDFRAAYAYNDAISFSNMPPCSDIRVECTIQSHGEGGRFGAALTKYGVQYRGWIGFGGQMVIASLDKTDGFTILARKDISVANPAVTRSFDFSNVDQKLTLQYDTETLTFDLGTALGSLEYRKEDPEAAFFGAGQMTLAHCEIFRDSYYTRGTRSRRTPRAVEGRPFKLNEDEFFVLGDNSPNSEDGRWWSVPEMVTRGQTPPRAGVVPREYLVGKAMFVYWPSGYQFPWPKKLTSMIQKGSKNNRLLRIADVILNLKLIPNIGQMRYIYGGSSETGAPPQTEVDPQSGANEKDLRAPFLD